MSSVIIKMANNTKKKDPSVLCAVLQSDTTEGLKTI